MLSISLPSTVTSPKSFNQSPPSTCHSSNLLISPRSVNLRRITCAATATVAAAATFAGVETTAFSSLYDVLGISAAASNGEIKAAYRRLARSCHPDVAGGSEDATAFIRINDAYLTLLDPEKRAVYDRSLVLRQPLTAARFYRMSASPSSSSSFCRSPRRNWESDQCW
ncbi:chaperone protein dnaJ 11, chloroplastic-like [Silene latifolia]|uniref:chaperone protein dnaJ 11, chloroplastic-like n=1 Tax=Silene latifolia TaxID=37657 RepID=UPI003D780D87